MIGRTYSTFEEGVDYPPPMFKVGDKVKTPDGRTRTVKQVSLFLGCIWRCDVGGKVGWIHQEHLTLKK